MENEYKFLYYSMIGAALATIALAFRIGNEVFAAFTACASMLVVFLLSCKIIKNTTRRTLLWAGIAFMVTSTVLDVGSTLLYSPSLELEGNPFARLMLDNDVPHVWLIIFGLVFQTLFLLTSCFIWSSFCGSLDEYVKRIKMASPPRAFFLEMYGIKGRGLSLLTGKVDCFMFINGIAPLLMGVFLYRMYLSLEWNGLAPISRIAAPTLSILIASMIQYFYLKRFISARSRDRIDLRNDL